jgi:hypothetical protein
MLPERHERTQGPGQNQVTGAQRVAEARGLDGEPAQRLERVAEAGRAVAGRTDLAVDGERHLDLAGLDLAEGAPGGADHVEPAGGVVGDGVAEGDPPVGDTRVDDLQRGQGDVDRGAHALQGDLLLGEVEVVPQSERDLGLHPRLHEAPHRDRVVGGDVHLVEEVAEVGLVDPELVLDGLRRRADLATHHPGPQVEALAHQALLHGVGRGEVVGADQVAHGGARDAGSQRVAEPVDGGLDGVRRGHGRNGRTCYSFAP